jgi:mannosyltransferase OCH1-like enzyme
MEMKKLNPEWKYELYDDNDMDLFVNTYFKGIISDAYNRLNIIVAKVDFWRYLILYKYGGVYLDMDSSIDKPLNELIKKDDDAILSLESNPNTFVNWCLIFDKDHIILRRTIDLIINNINTNAFPNDILRMTGPIVYSRAINDIYKLLYKMPLIYERLSLNTDITFQQHNIRFRIYGIDYNEYCTFKHKHCNTLYVNKKHWKQEQRENKLLK